MALDIWVVSSGGMITMGLNAVATVMENGGWKSTIWVAEMLGIAFCVMTYLRTHSLGAMFGWGMTFVLVTALLLTPKVTVVVIRSSRTSTATASTSSATACSSPKMRLTSSWSAIPTFKASMTWSATSPCQVNGRLFV
ncbi:hypothetical protein [Pantoea agglomerans]|uniref:hypothetical protein n=1 Tax=Enterobacter agglomerans TaxID=549 RepID=UPI00289C6A1A|nr:hypothetical protein [Pantoea agglomerans]WNK38084.1 hypothetical protein RM158_23870 [Pantoea agglomerans]